MYTNLRALEFESFLDAGHFWTGSGQLASHLGAKGNHTLRAGMFEWEESG